LGYIGLPTSLMLASKGLEVVGTDLNETIVNDLKNQDITFKEDGLEKLLKDAVDNGIEFTNEYQVADVYIIAVPTPYDEATKKIDPSYLISAIKSVVDVAKDGAILIIESTISPGTIDKIVRPIVDLSNKNIDLVHAPERILPGSMIRELVSNSRTIGADCSEIAKKVKNIYSSFCRGDIVLTDIKTAEMSKVVENTYRDINIAFANELAKICRQDNMDVYEIINIANKHPRVNILTPGPGVGGHCISVDPWFLVGDYPDIAKLIGTARQVNDSMPYFVFERLKKIMKDNEVVDMSRVGLYGMTYKPNVDDTRESPSIQFLELLDEKDRDSIKIYDPMVDSTSYDGMVDDFDDFLADVDLVLIMVDHNHLLKNEDRLIGKVIFDTKNVINKYPTYKL